MTEQQVSTPPRASRDALLHAGIGAVLPTLTFLANDVWSGYPFPGISALFALLVFAGCGVGVASAFKETHRLKAFILGMTFPSLLQAGAGHLQTRGLDGTSSRQRPVVRLAAATAVASPLPRSEAISHGARRLALRTPSDFPAYGVEFLSDERDQTMTITVDPDDSERLLEIPEFALSFCVRVPGYGKSSLAKLPIETYMPLAVEISRTRRFWSGFLRTIGVRSRAWDIGLELQWNGQPVEVDKQVYRFTFTDRGVDVFVDLPFARAVQGDSDRVEAYKVWLRNLGNGSLQMDRGSFELASDGVTLGLARRSEVPTEVLWRRKTHEKVGVHFDPHWSSERQVQTGLFEESDIVRDEFVLAPHAWMTDWLFFDSRSLAGLGQRQLRVRTGKTGQWLSIRVPGSTLTPAV